jgi:hypothetical protein
MTKPTEPSFTTAYAEVASKSKIGARLVQYLAIFICVEANNQIMPNLFELFF